MMEIVCLRTWEEWPVVARMSIQCVEDGKSEPEVGSGDMTSSKEHPKEWWYEVGKDMLQRMTIDSSHSYWGCPLVVCFMNILVEIAAVK